MPKVIMYRFLQHNKLTNMIGYTPTVYLSTQWPSITRWPQVIRIALGPTCTQQQRLHSRVEWFIIFLWFSKMCTLPSIYYMFMRSIPKNHRDLKNEYFLKISNLLINFFYFKEQSPNKTFEKRFIFIFYFRPPKWAKRFLIWPSKNKKNQSFSSFLAFK